MKQIDLKDVMAYHNFVVLGNTVDETKYAYKIKEMLLANGYQAAGVSKEFKTIGEVPFDIEVLDLCINPIKGLEMLKNATKPYSCVVIQPGAGSPEIDEFLSKQDITHIDGCLLVGCSLYGKKK